MYNQSLVVGAWNGNNNGEIMPNGWASTISLGLANSFFKRVINTYSEFAFNRPAGVMTTTVCTDTGATPAEGVECNKEPSLYISGKAPQVDNRKTIEVCKSNNLIPSNLEAAKKYDVVIGSRYCQGVNIINWPFRRLLISYFASKYVRIITGMPVKDPTSGFKCFRRRVLEAINLDSILSDGYAFQIEMNFRAWVKGFTIYEIPIVFTERRDGVSKMSRQIVWEAAWMVWRLQIMKLLGKIK